MLLTHAKHAPVHRVPCSEHAEIIAPTARKACSCLAGTMLLMPVKHAPANREPLTVLQRVESMLHAPNARKAYSCNPGKMLSARKLSSYNPETMVQERGKHAPA